MITLVPFGPHSPVPPGYRHCFSCDGSGVDSITGVGPCGICHGKGFWNREDMMEYHRRAPEVCRSTCGAYHVEPWIPSKLSQR